MAGYPPWHEQDPDRLAQERRAYADAGIDVALDEDLLRRRGVVVFAGTVVAAGRAWPLSVVYPPGFPFVRPEVVSPETRLPRHQNPYSRQLCLVENTDAGWAFDMTGADLVRQAARLLDDPARQALCWPASPSTRRRPASRRVATLPAPALAYVHPFAYTLVVRAPAMLRGPFMGRGAVRIHSRGRHGDTAVTAADVRLDHGAGDRGAHPWR